ncbi:hypothetical protein HPB51_004746 [Rhipicephalus microplus]|uniref:Uncharacterized protein n=1 Tax=Rhipicephalus microplus TaxID=6941 RepID=A0A9J6DSN8_RHIMP|nr:hypothetical protein HPB51_004746 [Rhipicephalus microplus]
MTENRHPMIVATRPANHMNPGALLPRFPPSPPCTVVGRQRKSKARGRLGSSSWSRGNSGSRPRSHSSSHSIAAPAVVLPPELGPVAVTASRRENQPLHEPTRFMAASKRDPLGPTRPLVWDAEVARLPKESVEFREMRQKIYSEMSEIRKFVVNCSPSEKASAPTIAEILILHSDSADTSKRTALSANEESVSQIYELKDMLFTLTASVQQLTQGLTRVKVALGDLKRGLGALADCKGAIERLLIPSDNVGNSNKGRCSGCLREYSQSYEHIGATD